MVVITRVYKEAPQWSSPFVRGTHTLGGLVSDLGLGNLGLGTFGLGDIATDLGLGNINLGLSTVLDTFGVGDTSLYTLVENADITLLTDLFSLPGVETAFQNVTLDDLVGGNSTTLAFC